MYDFLKNINLEYLMNYSWGEKLQEALEIIEQVQEKLHAYCANEDGEQIVNIRVGPVLALAVLKKVADGKMPKEFSQQDWMDIANSVSKYAICSDGKQYSAFVFELYARYIEGSVDQLDGLISKETKEDIRGLALELRSKTQQMFDEEISEADYVEECLWVALESMVKLMAAMLEAAAGKQGKEYAELAKATAIFALEYGRYRLYRYEQALITGYLEHQRELDNELQNQWDAYVEEMQKDAEAFRRLVEEAFTTNVRASLQASAQLARNLGVREEEILDTMEKIDDFFM